MAQLLKLTKDCQYFMLFLISCRVTLVVVVVSVTRFGKIPPLWQNFKSLWAFLRVFSILKIFEPSTSAKVYTIG